MSHLDVTFAAVALALLAAAALASHRYGSTNPRLRAVFLVIGFGLGAAYIASTRARDPLEQAEPSAEQ